MHAHVTNTGLDNRKFNMWVVICSECMLFGTLILNYLLAVSRVAPSKELELIKPVDILNIPITSASTFVLLMSSLAMVLCLDGMKNGDVEKFRKWCLATAILGIIFLGFQVFEFTEFYLLGLGLTSNLFGSAFFILTGTHGAHVFVGVILLLALYFWSLKTDFKADHHSVIVDTIALYWHFVDVIWIIIFTVVYLFVLAP